MDKEIIFEIVREILETSGLEISSPQEIAELMAQTMDALQDAGAKPVSPMRVSALTAMAVCGPLRGLPDDDVCDELEDLAGQFCDESDSEAIVDLVTAYGCGWRRDLGSHDSGWNGLWAGAFTRLVKRLRGICHTVSRSLGSRLNVPFPSNHEGLIFLLEDSAQRVASMLVQPVAPMTIGERLTISAGGADDPIFAGLSIETDQAWHEDIPTGARAVYQCSAGGARDSVHDIGFEVGDIIRIVSSETESNVQIWTVNYQTKRHEKKPKAGDELGFYGSTRLDIRVCTCGRKDCVRMHRLSAWDPGEEFGKLQYFLLNALRGKMQTVKAKDFAQSLLGSYWARHGWIDGSRLRLAEVVHRACPHEECREQDANQAFRIYLGDRCDRCGTVAKSETPLVTREHLIVVGAERSFWEFREYWRCGNPDCRVPDLASEGRTIVDPNEAMIRNACHCRECGESVWSREQYAEIEAGLADAKTMLEAARKLNTARVAQTCHNCGQPCEAMSYCTICESNGRSPRLPARPSWYFAPVRAEPPIAEAVR